MTPELEDAICEALYDLSGLVTKDYPVFVKLRDKINVEMEATQARVAATLALCRRIEDEARDFEPISNDGEVAMCTRIHMMGLVRHALTEGDDRTGHVAGCYPDPNHPGWWIDMPGCAHIPNSGAGDTR